MLTKVYISIVGLSFLSSLVSFWFQYPRHLKVFSLLLGLTFVVEYCAAFVVFFHPHNNNHPTYDVFMLVEFMVYAWYFKQIITLKKIRRVIDIFIFLFPVIWFISTFFIFGIRGWNSYVVLTGSFFTSCLCVAYYYELIQRSQTLKLFNHAEFWIATGLLIFYTCSLPYTGMLFFLNKNYLQLAIGLSRVMDVLDCLMYSLFIYAFLCRINIRKS